MRAYHFLTLALFATAPTLRATNIIVTTDITTGTGSTASQSSTLGAGWEAFRAIDGALNNSTHTVASPGGATQWWEVNLSTDRSLNVVRLYNRGDGCCPQRLRDLTVIVKDAGGSVIQTITGVNAGNSLGGPAFIDVNLGSVLSNARFIRVERTPSDALGSDDSTVLALGEVRIFSLTNQLLPLNTNLTHSNIQAMSVSQSSTLGPYSAANGVNGIAGDFTHTLNTDANPTWTVDFGEVMNLEGFNIGNRGDGCCQGRLRDITVTVKDSAGVVVYTSPLLNPENTLGDPSSLTGSFPANLTGRFVSISRTPDPDLSGGGTSADDGSVLSMSEVNIFGSSIPEPSLFALLPLAAAGLLRRRR